MFYAFIDDDESVWKGNSKKIEESNNFARMLYIERIRIK